MDKSFAIFDMDGTLVDSKTYWRHLTDEFLASRGILQVPVSVFEHIKPMTVTESAAFFIQKYDLAGTPESIAAEMNDIMEAHYRNDIPLKAGVQEYLEGLQRRGVTMCVASATSESLMELCLKRLGVVQYFSFLLSCETVGAGKNQPDVYLEAARRLGPPVEDIAVFEDAPYAVKTAAQAGFYTVAVRDTYNQSRWESLIELADEHISDWHSAAQTL